MAAHYAQYEAGQYGKVWAEGFMCFNGFKGTLLSPHSYTDFDYQGVNYRCVEQLLGCIKLKQFNREDLVPHVMMEMTGFGVRAIVRNIKDNFEEWKKTVEAVLPDIVAAVVASNPKFREELMATRGREILYSNQYDYILGTGVSLKTSPRFLFISYKNRSANAWGKALVKVREQLLEMEEVMKLQREDANTSYLLSRVPR